MSDSSQNELPPVLDEAPPVVDEVPPRLARSTPSFPLKTVAVVGISAIVLVAMGWGIGQMFSKSPEPTPAVAKGAPDSDWPLPQDSVREPATIDTDSRIVEPRDKELSNIKQVATAMAIYMTDYDDVFPHPIDDLSLLDPYLKNSTLIRSQLNGEPFSMNRRLSGYSATAVEYPASEPMVIGPTWPAGDRAVAFVDTHAKWVPTSAELDALRYATPYNELVANSRPAPTAKFGELSTSIVNGRTMLVPVGWKLTHTPASGGGIETYRWEGPEDEAYVKVDINRGSRTTSLEESVLKLERGFKQSSRYRYKRTNWRTGNQAYKGGVIWNFEISKDGAPLHKRGIAYFVHEGVDYAILVSRRADSPRDYSEMFTKIWSHAGKW